ncbi:MAG TPA: hypothetical protein DEP66_00015 [Acidimicrobiaceae bacterium]|nr:hypothetical protein [Acidimicrobiaceae bacterium]HCB36634.1 hypothetical protein [Acidimicrobiaceae bacterium]
MLAPRLLALDIDGTLLRDDGTISARTVRALGAARDRGLLLSAATGRPWPATSRIVAEVGGMDYAVCLNGTVVMDARTDTIVDTNEMTVAQACDTARLAREHLPTVRLAADLADGRHLWDHDFDTQMPMAIDVERVDCAEEAVAACGVPVLTWLLELEVAGGRRRPFTAELRDAERIIDALDGRLDPALDVHHSGIGPAEVSLLGISKATGLASVAERHGISPAEVMAIGDGYNDVEMLGWAGISVAMGNAPAEVQGAAEFVALSNADDGAAVFVEGLLARSAMGDTPAAAG